MNQKGMTMVEVLITVTIISFAVMVYTQFVNASDVEEKYLARSVNMQSIAIKQLEEERVYYKENEMEDVEENKDETVNYNGDSYEIEVIATKNNEIKTWKNEGKDFIKIKVGVKMGQQEMEVETYVTKGQ